MGWILEDAVCLLQTMGVEDVWKLLIYDRAIQIPSWRTEQPRYMKFCAVCTPLSRDDDDDDNKTEWSPS